jgi:hypothetical protein
MPISQAEAIKAIVQDVLAAVRPEELPFLEQDVVDEEEKRSGGLFSFGAEIALGLLAPVVLGFFKELINATRVEVAKRLGSKLNDRLSGLLLKPGSLKTEDLDDLRAQFETQMINQNIPVDDALHAGDVLDKVL